MFISTSPNSEFEKDSSVDLLELSYVRLLHMLSHHPDFGADLESLQLFAKYIEFFLETVSSSENISYLYIVSGQLKVVRDVLSETSDVSLPLLVACLPAQQSVPAVHRTFTY